ncbi:hypothetical protein JCM1840_004969 [Sporobolomyces johnsonii]
MSSPNTIEIKLSLDETTRLLTFPSSPAPVWANFAARVKERFSLDALPSAVLYVDNDGDEITVSSDAELAELWQSSADSFDSLTLLVVAPPAATPQPPARSPETLELLGSVAAALEQDPSLVHDLRNIVHSVCGPMRHGRHPHHHHQPFFGGRGGFGGRGRGKKGGRRGGWKMREESETSDTETEEQFSYDEGEKADKKKKKHRGSHKGFKQHRHRRFGPHSPPFPFYGPSPCCATPPPPHAHHGPPPPPPPPHTQHHFHHPLFHPGPPPPPAPFFSEHEDEDFFSPPRHRGHFGHVPPHSHHARHGRRSHGFGGGATRGGRGGFGRGTGFHSAPHAHGYAEIEEDFAQFGF